VSGEAILTTVTIFGSEYRIKGPDDPDYARRVAAEVDRRMREVAERQRINSPLRVAVLALLNMVDELDHERHRAEHAHSTVVGRARELELLLAAAVDAEAVGS
jgi:cell division protein ZapA